MIFKKIEQNIKQIIKSKPKILLGLSGGPDSVFLFYFFKKLLKEEKIELICAHLDHGWRKESERDVIFCQNLCKKYSIPLFCAHASNLSLNFKFNGSKEELGRLLRRHFLQTLAKKESVNFIALAHHLQDQQETFFWRIIRGCSLTGLTCMKPLDGIYLRPLLSVKKEEILHYLSKNQIKYLKDESNSSDLYLRNRIRKYVLPAMQKCDKRFDQKFESSIKQLQEEELFLKKLTRQSFEAIFFVKDKKIVGSLKKFQTLDKVLQKRVVLFWLIKEKIKFTPSQNYINEIIKFLKTEKGGSHQLGENWHIFKKKKLFGIKKNY